MLFFARTAIVDGSEADRFRRLGAVVEIVDDPGRPLAMPTPTSSDPLEKIKTLKTLFVDHHHHNSNSERNGVYTLIFQGPGKSLVLVWEKPGSEWQISLGLQSAKDGLMSCRGLWWLTSFERSQPDSTSQTPEKYNVIQLEEEFQRQMSRQLNDLLQKNEDLTRNVKDLSSNLEATNQQISELEAETSKQRAQIDEQQKQKNVVDQHVTDLELELRTMKDENTRFKDELEEYKQQNVEQKHELEAREKEIIEAEQDRDHWTMISAYIVGGVSVVIGFIIFQLARRTYKEMAEDMEWQMNEQRKIMKEPHPLVPVFPSVHANRLGVHEHPAVRDVFGMKEHWDVTPGEGFHVSRVTCDGTTPGTRGTRKFSGVLDVKEGDMEGAEGLPKVTEHNWDGVDPELSENNVVAERGEQLEV